ncbi:hypothetical protein GTU99_10970 [Streptomyces sp. PRKS01-65]|nr:hypothetical protein [Streptomyces harenosi]NEY32707.1 hypothetical protein [Streptomyces harenosi]
MEEQHGVSSRDGSRRGAGGPAKRRVGTLLAATALAFGSVLLGAGAAQAEPPAGSPCLAITGATVCFETSGDDFHVADTDADGASARANWWVNYERDTPHCTNSNGANTWHECRYDMREGYQVCWRPEVYDGSEGRLIRYGSHRCVEI